MVNISVLEMTGRPQCYSVDDAQEMYNRISLALARDEKEQVVVSFLGASFITPTFLNTMIGQLYGSFSWEHIRQLLKIEGMRQEDTATLRLVVSNAKRYFENQEAVDV